MAHKPGQGYSGKNPVPRMTTKLTSLVSPEKATDAKVQQLQDGDAHAEEKQTKTTATKLSKGHSMQVTDPTTGEELTIHDAAEVPDTRTKGNNVLHQLFPQPDWEEHRKRVLSFTNPNTIYICLTFAMFFVLSTTLSSMKWRLICFIPPALLSYCLLFRVDKEVEEDFDRRIWHAERMRGLAAGSDVNGDKIVTDKERTKESAEWTNALISALWPIINSDMFSSGVDLLEDIMQSSVPAFIHSVRVADLGLGSTAGRITSIRSLPDTERREEGKSSLDGLGIDAESISPGDVDALDGDHVNLEVSFAYKALPSGRTAESKAQNIHLLIEFFLGLKNVYGFKVPVWVEITGAVGTARARLQLIPDPPFVKTTLITLMGLPRITISVIPMNRVLPNVMNLPFISGFISSALDTAAAEYVAPKSLTLDLQRLIRGDEIKKDTEAIGVLIVHIHRATGIKKMDMTGASDPYVTLTFSRLQKPLYSTRIIKQDLNPVFEETAVLIVDVNTVRLGEKVSFQLWDSDRMSVDDMMGFAELDIIDLIRHRGHPVRRLSTFTSPDSQDRPGSIEYTVGYYGKLPPQKTLMTDGTDPNIPEGLREQPEFKNAKTVILNDTEAAVLVTPPCPEWPSGLLSVQVHEIRDLSVKMFGRDRKGGNRGEGEKGQDAGEETEEQQEGLPSSYCTISLNDELVYETRVKPITSSPIFNAGTERFVRDWRKAHVAVTVKDSRMRENNVVLGTVFLKLSEVFVNASEVTRSYSIEKGLGSGRIRISLLFRPVEAKLPPNLLGFDTGTLVISKVSVPSHLTDLAKCEIRLKITTAEVEEKVSYKTAQEQDDRIIWSSDSETKLPVRQRYAAALILSFRDKSGFKSSGRKALAVLWLRDIVDRTEGPVEIALWRTKSGDYSRLKSNYVPPYGDLSCWDSDREKVEKIGSVFLNLVFWPGITGRHYEMVDGRGAKRRSEWDEYDRQRTGGMREDVGTMDAQVPQQHQARGSYETEQGEGEMRRPVPTDEMLTGGPVNRQPGDDNDTREDAEGYGVNTAVSADDVKAAESPKGSDFGTGSNLDERDRDLGKDDNVVGNDEENAPRKKGLVEKVKDWHQHEKELHRDHRGMMQAKPMRTAEWLKDNVKDSAYAVKDKFKMKARQPDVETEV